MRAMAAREADEPKLEGRVEIDDAYLGGERGRKRGRGAAGKTPFVAAVETSAERRPKRLRLAVVDGFRKRAVEKLAKRDFAAGSTIVSDGLSCWKAVIKAGCSHTVMATGTGKQAASSTPFDGVEPAPGRRVLAHAAFRRCPKWRTSSSSLSRAEVASAISAASDASVSPSAG